MSPLLLWSLGFAPGLLIGGVLGFLVTASVVDASERRGRES